MPHASNRLHLNTTVGPSILRSRSHSSNRPRGGTAMRAVPSGPTTTMLAGPGDVVVAEKEISLKFVEVRYLGSVAGNTSQQGPQHPLVHAGNGRKYNAPGVYNSRVYHRHPKHTALGSPRNAAYDSSHCFFANSIESLDFDDLASE